MRRVALLGTWVLVAFTSLPATAQGLVVDLASPSWARVQGRLGYAARPVALGEAAATRPPLPGGASVLGDVYLGARPGGWRATSGLLLDPAGGTAALSIGASAGPRLGLATRAVPLGAQAPDALWARPYLGIGYTALAAPGAGWRFSADLGVVLGDSPRAARGGLASSLDDTWRDPRLAPLLHVGASYSF